MVGIYRLKSEENLCFPALLFLSLFISPAWGWGASAPSCSVSMAELPPCSLLYPALGELPGCPEKRFAGAQGEEPTGHIRGC